MNQLVELEQFRNAFKQKNAEVVAVAVQSPNDAGETQDRLRQATGSATTRILPDDGTIAADFGVYARASNGQPTASPSVFIVGRDGMIAYAYVSPNDNVRPAATAVVGAVP